jgi:hypothetical protein
MVSVKMKPIPPLKMESKTCRLIKGAFRHSSKLGPKSLSKTCMKVTQKIQVGTKSSRRAKKHKVNRKVSTQNIEIRS